jgi:hypothetical protein
MINPMVPKSTAVKSAIVGSKTVNPTNIINVRDISAISVDMVPSIPKIIVVTPVVNEYKVC